MVKKKVKKLSPQAKKPETKNSGDAPAGVSRQTAGAVAGAVMGAMVAGPVGAMAGGAVGALIGDSSDKGKKPLKRAADAVREEVTSGRAKAALKSVEARVVALGSKVKQKFTGKKQGAATKTKKVAKKKAVKASGKKTAATVTKKKKTSNR